MILSPKRLWLTVVGLALLGTSCTSPSASIEAAPASPAEPALLPLHAPYPHGRWRQHEAELEHVVLWPSHLLIRYAGAKVADSVSFTMAEFHSVPPPATRTRGEALALATELARRARAEPNRFAELVREHSEDLVRREAGGSLGGIPAAQLVPWPEVLDALSQLRPGEVSDPVETWYGFHILIRRAPPPPSTVTGRRIVISHAEAGFQRILSGVAPTRSRADALALAERIYAEARARPESFPELVRQHSEHRDRVLGGDFGTWSNREPTPFPREIEVLDALEVGEVAPPFDSLFGFQIVQRVENEPRPTYAIDGLRLYFQADAADAAPSSRENVLALAQRYHRELLQNPGLLPELQARHRRYHAQWLEGRGSPEVTAALAAVAPGELSSEPARSASSYVIGRRAEPQPECALEPAFELP